MLVLLLMLSIAVAALWQRLRMLNERVVALEGGAASQQPPEWVADAETASVPSSPWSIPAEAVPRSAPASARSPVAGPTLRPIEDVAPMTAPDLPATGGPETDINLVHAPPRAPTLSAEPQSPAGFEEIFGRRLPIWAGGATLAVAGFLVVRYSIEAGLLSPAVRIVMGLIFGTALIAAAEAALRRAAAVGDDRVRQALAGAGVATLYGSILAAANLYALVGPATAFVGLAAVTMLAGGLSLRFGAPSAMLGLIGGLAAPALVGSSQPNVPLLAAYLALAIGGLCALGRQQRWWWLGAAALAGGFAWGALLILGDALDLAGTVSVGAYTIALGVLLPLLVTGGRSAAVRAIGALAGCAQLAALVAAGGFAPLHWALFGLIAAALGWLSRREPLLADAPILALGVAILLMVAWPAPPIGSLAAVLAGAGAIFGVPAARRVWREDARATDAPILAMLALATGLVPMIHDDESGLPALIGAAIAGILALRGWRSPARGDDPRLATLTLSAASLLVLAGMWTLPGWTWAPLIALVAFGLHHVAHAAGDRRVELGGWVFAAGTGMLLMGERGAERLLGIGTAGGITAWLTWAFPAAAFAGVALDRRMPVMAARVFQAAAALLCYGAAAQVVPAAWLPLVPAAMVATMAVTGRGAAAPALLSAAAVSAGWAAMPLAGWTDQALQSATGTFIAASAWPSLADAAPRLAVPAAALLAAIAALPIDPRHRRTLGIGGGAVALVALHLGVVHLFGIETRAAFVARAIAERFCWEAVLATLAAVAWRQGATRVAAALGMAAFAHLAWFGGLVANPLMVAQRPGPWLALSYALGGALLWGMPWVLPDRVELRDRIAMALIVVAAFTLLRQAAHAPMPLSGGTGPDEQIARSLLALALAGGFLWFGIRRAARDWRIVSLALMLIAVAKVFLHDAAGLDGLARIASLAVLGFSLIGVGWLYSRYLPTPRR